MHLSLSIHIYIYICLVLCKVFLPCRFTACGKEIMVFLYRKKAKVGFPLPLTCPYHLDGTALANSLAVSCNYKHSCLMCQFSRFIILGFLVEPVEHIISMQLGHNLSSAREIRIFGREGISLSLSLSMSLSMSLSPSLPLPPSLSNSLSLSLSLSLSRLLLQLLILLLLIIIIIIILLRILILISLSLSLGSGPWTSRRRPPGPSSGWRWPDRGARGIA